VVDVGEREAISNPVAVLFPPRAFAHTITPVAATGFKVATRGSELCG
jgi:hypothetical protein